MELDIIAAFAISVSTGLWGYVLWDIKKMKDKINKAVTFGLLEHELGVKLELINYRLDELKQDVHEVQASIKNGYLNKKPDNR